MVKLPDRLTVATCDTVRQFVAEQLAQYGDVRVDASSVDVIDLSGVQIIVAAAQSARQANRSFSLAGPASPPVTRAFELAGISLESFAAPAEVRA